MTTSGPGAVPSTPSDYSTLTTNIATGKVKASKGPDTLTKIDVSQKVDTIAPAPMNLDRPKLPVANSQVPQALIFIAEAFAAIFMAMASSSNTDLTTLVQDQNLNITQSKGVLDTTNTTIKKQQDELAEYNKIQSEAHNPWLKVLQIVLGVAMALVIIATIVSGLVDGGASEAAVPEEVAGATAAEGAVASSTGGASAAASSIAETSFMSAEATEVGATTGTTAATTTGSAAGSAAADSGTIMETNLDELLEATQGATEGGGDTAGAGAGAGAAGSSAAGTSATVEGTEMTAMESTEGAQLSGAAGTEDTAASKSAEQVAEQVAKQAAKTAAAGAGDSSGEGGAAIAETSFMGETPVSTSEISQMTEEGAEAEAEGATTAAAKTALSNTTRVLIGMVAGAIGGLPDLIQGIQSIKLKGMYEDLASLQKEVGKASSQQSLANSYFQFLQSACKRMSSLTISQMSGGSDVVKAYADILSTFQQAAQTSRQSVV